MKRIVSLAKKPPSFLILLVEATIISLVVHLVVTSRYQKKLLMRLRGEFTDADTPHILPTESEQSFLKLMRQVIRTMSRHVPWSPQCYNKALTARYMLKKRGIKTLLIIGFYKPLNEDLRAHAWLKSGNLVILGNNNIEQFKEISVFH